MQGKPRRNAVALKTGLERQEERRDGGCYCCGSVGEVLDKGWLNWCILGFRGNRYRYREVDARNSAGGSTPNVDSF